MSNRVNEYMGGQETALKTVFLFFTKLRNDAESNLIIANYFPGSVFLAEFGLQTPWFFA